MNAESPGEAETGWGSQQPPSGTSRSRARPRGRRRSRRVARAPRQRALACRLAGHDVGRARAQRAPDVFRITPGNLRRLALSIHQPIFWLGPKAGITYELTRGRGREDLRPLPARGRRRRQRQAVSHGRDISLPRRVRGGPEAGGARRAPSRRSSPAGRRRPRRGYPESVHVAYPNVDYQVEVYDPTPARAMQLVSAG